MLYIGSRRLERNNMYNVFKAFLEKHARLHTCGVVKLCGAGVVTHDRGVDPWQSFLYRNNETSVRPS
jgi:hypothetical protein